MRCGSPCALAALAGLAGAAPVLGQPAPPPSRVVDWRTDSGPVGWAGPDDGQARAVYSTVVTVPGAAWVRLAFSDVALAGVIEEGSGSSLRITSLADGAWQYLDAESAAQWANTSAYFNGESVLVELMAYPGTGDNRLAIVSVTAGEPEGGAGADTICGSTDDRVPSTDPRTARHSVGCTAWMWNDTNRMFGTAGHCSTGAGHSMHFNVPLATSGGGYVAPPPQDQYPVDASSVQFANGGTGEDWAYFATFPNSNTGLTPFQKQGASYTLAASAPASGTPTIRVTGHGVNDAAYPVSPTWNRVQRTHTGPYAGLTGTRIRYSTDTTGGNSGSPVMNDSAGGVVIGVHTHGGCSSGGGSNSGTAVQHAAWSAARNNPLGLARSGRGTVTGSLYAMGDAVNNFGTCSTATGNFAKVNVAPPRMEGLAYSWTIGKFYAVSNDTFGVAPGGAGRKLWTIDPATGAAAYVANITGASVVINGLAFDPASGTLYGIAQATGQLYRINTATGAATINGSASGGTVGALELNPFTGVLYGIDDSTGASRLVSFNRISGAKTVIGPLGAGIFDCNGLAVTEGGALWTINAATEELLRIDPATGAATVIGGTGGVFGASFGMSAVLAEPVVSCYPNCDGSTLSPVLNVGDFTCFLQEFASGAPYANCDGSTLPPVLNVGDFTCFLQRFAAGCP